MFSFTLTNAVVVVSVIASARATCLHGTTFMRRNEGEIPAPTFSYEDETGPLNWHNLNENNTACATGDMQSPIVLTSDIPFAAEAPKWHIAPVQEAEFENLGTTLEVFVEGALDYAGKNYKLKQYHVHSPSEHRIGREFYPLEVHFVHQAESGELAVVGIPFDISEDGATTDFLTGTVKNLAEIAEPLTKTKTGPLDFSSVIGAVSAQQLYEYQGSLTTPPCAQGVTFLILSAPLPIDVKTFNALKKIIKYNSRPTQNIPGKQNILQIASANSTPPPEGGAADGTTTGTVDVDALMQAFFESGKKMKYETVTKVETVVTLVDETEQPPVDQPPTEPTDPTTTEPSTPADPAETGTDGEPLPTDTQSEPIPTPTDGGEAPPADEGNDGKHAPGPAAPPARRRSNMVKRRV